MARGGPVLGKIEEAFLETLAPGDTFLFAGKVLRFEGIRENECFVSNAPGKDAKVPYYAGGKFPLSTYLADQVRGMLADPERWKALPEQVADWLRLQAESRCCRSAATCWSRPFRAATASTWSPIPSRAGWRTRRSACC